VTKNFFYVQTALISSIIPGKLYIALLSPAPCKRSRDHRLGDLVVRMGDTWPQSMGEKRQSRRHKGGRMREQ